MNKNKNKILVIEDDEKIRNSIVSILEEEDFDVYSAADGKTGLKLAQNISPLLILCDIMLPEIDGYEICEILHSAEETKNIIFIFLTAKTELSDIRHGMNLGADDYITKPFKASDLVNTIYTRIKKYDDIKDREIKHEEKLSLESNLFVKHGQKTKILKVAEISAISAEGVYSTIFCEKGDKYILRKSLKEWESALPEQTFIRIHRSYIINQNKIEKIEPWYKHSLLVKMENINDNFYISERYAAKLKKRFSF